MPWIHQNEKRVRNCGLKMSTRNIKTVMFLGSAAGA
jgi:hypothetical protein